MELKDKVVIVTGASGGLGYTLANILNDLNAKVIGVYNQTLIKAIFETYKCDISNEDEVKDLFSYVIKKYQKIDAVINCAAFCYDEEYFAKSIDDFMQVVKVNLGGTFLIDKYACLNMHKGTIINVSSTDATDTYSSLSMDYAASKAGVENLTKNFAKMMPNLKICAIAPAWIDTDAVLKMDPHYLKEQMQENNQKELLHKEKVAKKIIEMIKDDKYRSGMIVRMEHNHE